MVSTGRPKRRKRDPNPGNAQIKGVKREAHRIPPHLLSRIPEELLSEILSRLPARSVIRFRCVCKQWQSITHHSFFIDAHLDRARKSGPPSILLFLKDRDSYRFGITIFDQNSKPPKHILWGPKPKDFGKKVLLGNSCNGLLCIYFKWYPNERIKVINPTTGESLTLPEHTKTRAGTNICPGSYLGFHSETKEYKVIRFFYHTHSLRCEVYTLGTSSWRKIPIQHFSGCLQTPITVNEIVYWLMHYYDDDNDGWTDSVLAFDLKHEKFTRISLPSREIDKGKELPFYFGHLVDLHGSVCLTVCHISSSIQLDIWMMTMNIDTRSNTNYEWARKYSLLLPRVSARGPTPILIHNEEILVHTSKRKGHRSDSGDENDDRDEDTTLIYYHLNSKLRVENKVFYHEEKFVRRPICHYLEGQYGIDNTSFNDYTYYRAKPFVHIESLVPLRSQ